MATTVYDVVEIQLSNGESLTLKPLPIKQVREFMEIMKEMEEIGNEEGAEDKAMDVFIKASMHCLKNIKPELSTNQEKFEDAIEIPTMMKILEICGGLKLTDPNLLGAALIGTN